MSIPHVGPTTGRELERPGARAAEISQLFREHNRALVLFLASRLKDMQAAREVAQEAYVRLLQLEGNR
jgi:DNA-directed RNA polymerase specialized sigma24 family protein